MDKQNNQQKSINSEGWEGLTDLEVENKPPEPTELDKCFFRTFKLRMVKKFYTTLELAQ